MKKRRIIIFTIFCYLYNFIALSSNMYLDNKVKPNEIVISDYKNNQLEFNDFTNNISIILLKNNEHSFGKITDLCIQDSLIYILDGTTTSLFVFNSNNSDVVNKISINGVNPNEYTSPIAIDIDSNFVYILDKLSKKIVCYNKNLTPAEPKKIDFNATDFIKTENGFAFYNSEKNNGNFELIITDNNCKALKKYFPYENDTTKFKYKWDSTNKHFKRINNEIFLNRSHSSNIYKINKDIISNVINLNFEKDSLPKSININSFDVYKQDKYAICLGFFILHNTFINSFLKNGKLFYSFMDFENTKPVIGSVNENEYLLPFYPRWQNNNQLIGTCSFSYIKEALNNTPIKPANWLIENFKDEDNLLIIYNIQINKKFNSGI